MHQDRENLDIIFRKRTPEDVLNKIRTYYDGYEKESYPYELCSFEMYDYFGFNNMIGYSGDEIRMRYEEVHQRSAGSDSSIFALLYEYCERILIYKNHEPLCKIDQILGWNSITSRLGQDLFVTAWLAYKDIEKGIGNGICPRSFDWPYCIHSDDARLNQLLQQGVAENHFHLGGSTQSFALSWAALMNHPEVISRTVREAGRFKRNMVSGCTDFSEANEARWMNLLRYAAYIRALFFQRCINILDFDMAKYFRDYDRINERFNIINRVDQLRMSYGAKVSRVFGGKCLDYAMSTKLYAVDPDGYNRLLAGERALMYSCFRHIYLKEFTTHEMSLFYLYLLIKNNFRGELIQINRRNGFYNFLQYQNRKEQFYPFREYVAEAQRLAICSSIEDNHICFLEARFMPQRTAGRMARKIFDNDRLINIANPDNIDKTFYVVHFAKDSFVKKEVEKTGEYLLRPRNWKVRKLICCQAKAVYAFRQDYYGVRGGNRKSLQARLCGMDACASEIGCRPESFATEFRFLRNHNVFSQHNRCLLDMDMIKDLGITYHVGEDFLDICDGLRAVDEAVDFLELQNGDRIGHGLVLGVDAKQYYASRYYRVYLTKQDYLDNCVWLLYRTLEWGIPLGTAEREYLKQEAYRVANEVYGCFDAGKSIDRLEALYYSWHLRGDHPDIYRSGLPLEKQTYSVHPYDLYRKGNKKYEEYRKDTVIVNLCYKYHFDRMVKLNGLRVLPVDIKPWYVELMTMLQEYIRCNLIAKNGIAIECNPTSNKLIGYFNNYDEHPIQKFSDHILNVDSKNAQIITSINTDDLGVFNTSLNYEYALLLSALRRKRHSEGNDNDECIYEYLDHIRKNGFKIAFSGNSFH